MCVYIYIYICINLLVIIGWPDPQELRQRVVGEGSATPRQYIETQHLNIVTSTYYYYYYYYYYYVIITTIITTTIIIIIVVVID